LFILRKFTQIVNGLLELPRAARFLFCNFKVSRGQPSAVIVEIEPILVIRNQRSHIGNIKNMGKRQIHFGFEFVGDPFRKTQ